MVQPLLNIGIAGAGIGGLAAASLLADQGHEVTVFDQFETPQPVGSGLVIQPVGRRVLDVIGAGDKARSYGHEIKRMLGSETTRNKRVLDVSYGTSYGLAIHRAALFDSLFKAAQTRDLTLQQSHQVTGHTNHRLEFEDGTCAGPFDLIIDASGARSALSPLKSRALPFGAIWTSLDWPETDVPLGELSQRYTRANNMIGVMPIGTMPNQNQQKAALFWSLPQDSYSDWQLRGLDHWRQEVRMLWPALEPFLDQITSVDQMTMARYTHGTLRRPFGDGIVYIGDAAHRASPQLGQGANMALLDAWALSEALKHFPVTKALPAYARARRGHVKAYQWMSAAFTPFYQSNSSILPVLRDRVMFPLSMTPPTKQILTAMVKGTMLPPLGYLTPMDPSAP
ncbi:MULTISPECIES: FAD-dependent oxidoreductase [Pacificibacter]|uniref:FAD-dependent oxidoreductase n=1 Tax=Pacificibacter TaxID=1042323 RepID=UPI001C091877|nr:MULTISPECIES: NAD(P)/FAD-dependent oxidoreductase [Pacificibacter]MBU2934843.1 FAD-dependent monooxygenase [Pacificibacter marinus]MDO6615817.1 NAD(P)/FAD-dependent oxidoreductase [Pacificibacter sp. 1_MG-2023]